MKRILSGILIGVVSYSAIFLLLFFSKEITQGIQNGIDICLSLMIPSTFLFLILTDILSRSRAGRVLARPFSFLSKIFKIRPCDIDIVILSLIGGYPVGARILADRVKSGMIDHRSASRMLAFCVNSSPAFLYTGVGISIFHSAAVGIIFLLSSLLACFITGILVHFIQRQSILKVRNNIFLHHLYCSSLLFKKAYILCLLSVAL